MTDLLYDYMKRKNLLPADRGKARRAYIAMAFMGDVDPDENPLDGELEAELPDELQNVKPLNEN
jgi:hypothetical protein